MRTAKKGLTLLEVILATGIFSIVMLGTSGAWFVHQRAINSGSARTTASFLALQELNRCVSSGYPNLSTASQPNKTIEINNRQNGRSSKSIFVSSTAIQEDPVTKFKRVYVQVAWNESRGLQSINYEVYLHPSNEGIKVSPPSSKSALLDTASAEVTQVQ